MNNKIEFKNHDYAITLGDKVLAQIKKTIANAEFRHSVYQENARFHTLIPGLNLPETDSLETTIKFADKSKPIHMSSPIMLSAGACKYAKLISQYAYLGYGAITVGTATGKKRTGNDFRPRVALIEADRCINNSMGLNNPGIKPIVKATKSQIKKIHRNRMSVGISVAESPEISDHKERLDDLLQSFTAAYNVADYVEINVSCPNTGNQRVDENLVFIEELFNKIMDIRDEIPERKAVYAKISPDMDSKQLYKILDILYQFGVNGIILFNTFPGAKSKELNLNTSYDDITVVTKDGARGGLSGRALYENTFNGVKEIKSKYPDFSVIASGGIDHGAKAWDLINLGADAVQCYSVVAFRWNAIHKIRAELKEKLTQAGFNSLNEFNSRKK